MARLILTTAGTAVARAFDKDPVYSRIKGRPLTVLEELKSEIAELKSRLLRRLKELDLDTKAGLDSSSAEIKSLKKIGVSGADRVILLATDTADGKLCADVVADFISVAWGCHTTVEVIPGLQVKDAHLFEREGIKNYLKKLISYIEDPNNRYGYEIIINPTGGFKSVVPYTTILAMVFQIPSKYVFEFSDELLTLPPIPLDFNFSLVEKHVSKFERIYEESYIPDRDFWEGVPYEERGRYEPFLEHEGGHVTLSSIGLIVFEGYRAKNPPPIPTTVQRPDAKDGLKDDGSEPHRTKAFLSFRDKLKEHPHADYFRYKRPAHPKEKKVAVISHKVLEATYEGIVVEIQTTATHPKHNETIKDEMRSLMDLGWEGLHRREEGLR